MDFDEMEIRKKKKKKQTQNFKTCYCWTNTSLTIDSSYSFTDYLYEEYIHSRNATLLFRDARIRNNK